mgnify:CR=1 FL=1
MRQIFPALATLAALALGACSNFETSGNGAFDGYWQLEQTDTLSTGGTTDMRDSLVFWSVQHRLIELCCRLEDPRTLSPVRFSVFYHFERSGDSLRFLADPLPVLDLRSAADPYASMREVQPYGFTRLDEAFRMLLLDDDRMTLQSQSLRMYFRKY